MSSDGVEGGKFISSKCLSAIIWFYRIENRCNLFLKSMHQNIFLYNAEMRGLSNATSVSQTITSAGFGRES